VAEKVTQQKNFDFAQQEAIKPKNGRRTAKRANELDGTRWLINSISVWSDIRKSAEEAALKHPAMFPSMLVERFIESFTTGEQKTILDPFMGSGSVLVAAQRLGRYGIGVELNPEYAALARRRLSQDMFESKPSQVQYEIHEDDARKLLAHVAPNSIDMTVTSPPYWDILNQSRTADNKEIRHYGNLEADLGIIADYEEFIGCLQEVFEQVHIAMKPDSYCIVVVMDLRKKSRFFPFHSDVAAMMGRVGFVYDDLIIWNRQSEYNNLRPLGYPAVFRINKVHEFCLIFKTRPSGEKDEFDEKIVRDGQLHGP